MRQINQFRKICSNMAAGTSRKAGLAFTIIELLVVISIMGLLMTLLIPAIHAARKQTYKTKTEVRIKALSDACYFYYDDTGRRYFPGQQYPQLIGSATTGSQLLAIALCNPKGGNGTTAAAIRTGTGAYLTYSEEYFLYTPRTMPLVPPEVNDPANPQYLTDPLYLVLGDAFPGSDHSAILYYPSRLEPANADTESATIWNSGNVTQFAKYRFHDNYNETFNYSTNYPNLASLSPLPLIKLTDQEIKDGVDATHKAREWANPTALDPDPVGLITDTKLAPPRDKNKSYNPPNVVQPFNPDSFLIIAPGYDRKYFSADDQRNF
jgi:type II secretory pathway pseudopilin PulG